ncbi:hypothetical protein V2J09_005356 [Rumex salicifolius]
MEDDILSSEPNTSPLPTPPILPEDLPIEDPMPSSSLDDVIIFPPVQRQSSRQRQPPTLDDAFTIKDLGEIRYFLGLEVARSEDGIVLNQRKYVYDILQDSKLVDCKAARFPMQRNLKLSIDQGQLLDDQELYRRLVGRLLYLNLTRPDISYASQHLSQFVSSPRVPHLAAALHVVRYLKGTE